MNRLKLLHSRFVRMSLLTLFVSFTSRAIFGQITISAGNNSLSPTIDGAADTCIYIYMLASTAIFCLYYFLQ